MLDSTVADSAGPRSPASPKNPTLLDPGAARADSTKAFWTHPRVGFGIGWTLGSFKLFSLWQKGLPDSLGDFGVLRTMSLDNFGGTDTASEVVRLVVRQNPDAYNVHFPLHFSFTTYTTRTRFLSTDVSFTAARKAQQTSIRADSIGYRLDVKRSLNFLTAAVGLSLHQAIPMEFFSLNEIDETYVTLGVAFHPLTAFKTTTRLSHPGSTPDSVEAFDRSVKQSVHDRLTDITAWGTGISWTVGITAMRLLTPAGGTQFSLAYTGAWFGGFRNNGANTTMGDLDPDSHRGKTRVSSISHRMELQVQLLRGKKPPPPPDTTAVAQ
jgi:hypothetical protein